MNAADPVVANNAVALDAAEVVLKGFVLGSHPTLGQYEQHLVPLMLRREHHWKELQSVLIVIFEVGPYGYCRLGALDLYLY